jgi:hypothetical protein
MTLDNSPKTLLGISMVILIFASGFSILNAIRVKTRHANFAGVAAGGSDTPERRQLMQEQAPTSAKANARPMASPDADTESKAAKAEADFAQVLKEKADLQSKLQASQAEITSLQNRTQEPGPEAASVNPGAPSTAELQAQLDDTRRQLDSAERENTFLSEKLGPTREHPPQMVQSERKRREAGGGKPGVRGSVLAVNQAYNFVVLNLGSRQGIQANSEMVVFREGVLIGKIRISSVEPATAIGDVMTNSLARGVQVQPGDTVVYVGPHS